MAEAPKRPPKDPKKERYRGAIFVERDRCKGCGFCVEFCPYGALELAPDYNVKGYHPPVLAHPDQCNGCDLCGLYCPDFAIFALRYNNPDYVGKPKAEPAAAKSTEVGK
jgi:2-oxoglutarate ferredoxin oxidoreductase subunit delta